MGRPTTIIGDGNIKKLLMRPHAPQKHDKLVLFFLTLPTTAKWRFGFALVLAYAPTLVLTLSKKIFFFSNKD
jgi:hypothetical protein